MLAFGDEEKGTVEIGLFVTDDGGSSLILNEREGKRGIDLSVASDKLDLAFFNKLHNLSFGVVSREKQPTQIKIFNDQQRTVWSAP
jgi:hypothetical protein